jgi:crotonobetainyl-CoA:carnitine CoA-transferase CaiB-like acyl-CoA transferase
LLTLPSPPVPSVPGKLDKFGLSYSQLSPLNPRLIYCSVTGYGSTGPYASAPGYDVVIEAEAGLMHITGEKEGKPVKVGVAVTDVLTGHYAHSGILAALLKRERTGKGGRVECSLFESQVSLGMRRRSGELWHALACSGSTPILGAGFALPWRKLRKSSASIREELLLAMR